MVSESETVLAKRAELKNSKVNRGHVKQIVRDRDRCLNHMQKHPSDVHLEIRVKTQLSFPPGSNRLLASFDLEIKQGRTTTNYDMLRCRMHGQYYVFARTPCAVSDCTVML